MSEGKIFRPMWRYWLKTWLPLLISWLVIVVLGVRQNVGTETYMRALSFGVFSSILLIGLMFMVGRQQIVVMPEGLFVQTIRKSFYWAWEQITAVNFYAVGEESKPQMFVSTEEKNYRFDIHAFDEVMVEDAITEIVGVDEVGWGAYMRTEKYQKAKEEWDLLLQRWGEEKRYMGGPMSRLFYIFTIVYVGGLLGTALLFFAVFENTWLAAFFVALALISLWRMMSLVAEVYINRDHVVCKRPFQNHMIWWRDIISIEVSRQTLVFRGVNQTLVCPGFLFWSQEDYKKMLYIFNRQCEERQIYLQPIAIFAPFFSRNVKTERFSDTQ